MILIKVFIISILFLLIIDLYLKFKPKSRLFISPLSYRITHLKKDDVINCEFEILNLSPMKETMIPYLNFDLDFFNKGVISKFNYDLKITIANGNKKEYYKNYWPTTIIKSKSSIKIYAEIKFKKFFFINDEFIWLKINWRNYGHFGLIEKQNCFLINNSSDIKKYRKIIKIPLNKKYEAIAIKTSILGSFDDPIKTVYNYCKDIIEPSDILVIGETPLAIMQGRYENPNNIRFNLISQILCYFFHPTSSLATACGMQILINKIGVTRITFSLLIGSLFKFFGIKGIFYILTGSESSLIDDISGTTVPYDKTIVLGPLNSMNYVKRISKILKVDSAVADVNDLGGVKVLASSSKSATKILNKVLKSNPAGNDDQKTPIVLIRKKRINNQSS